MYGRHVSGVLFHICWRFMHIKPSFVLYKYQLSIECFVFFALRTKHIYTNKSKHSHSICNGFYITSLNTSDSILSYGENVIILALRMCGIFSSSIVYIKIVGDKMLDEIRDRKLLVIYLSRLDRPKVYCS